MWILWRQQNALFKVWNGNFSEILFSLFVSYFRNLRIFNRKSSRSKYFISVVSRYRFPGKNVPVPVLLQSFRLGMHRICGRISGLLWYPVSGRIPNLTCRIPHLTSRISGRLPYTVNSRISGQIENTGNPFKFEKILLERVYCFDVKNSKLLSTKKGNLHFIWYPTKSVSGTSLLLIYNF
jgi:hypothetical protein